MESFSEPRAWLEAEYLTRREKNPAYSLRAFAKLLELPSGRVSQLLSRKRPFTRKLGEKIALRLSYDPRKTHYFLECISAERKDRGKRALPRGQYEPLDMDRFQVIADPAHFALLSLFETEKFRDDPKFVAGRLGISALEARATLERLARVGLIEKNPRGKYRLAQAPGLTTTHDIPSGALRTAHKKALAESAECLDSVPVESRDITSITMAIDPARLPEAKAKLKALRRELADFLETGKRTEVYRLNVQLVPVTKEGGRK